MGIMQAPQNPQPPQALQPPAPQPAPSYAPQAYQPQQVLQQQQQPQQQPQPLSQPTQVVGQPGMLVHQQQQQQQRTNSLGYPQQNMQPSQPQIQQSQLPLQQQQQQQHFPHQGLKGGWQSDNDYQERRKMIAKIVLLLRQRKPNAPQEWLTKLPQMAKRLEESLYRSAKSFEEYNDGNTLKHRLQEIAVNIGMKTKRMQQQQQALQQQQQQILQQQHQQQPTMQQLQQPVNGQPQLQQLLPAPVQQQQQPSLMKPLTQEQQPRAPSITQPVIQVNQQPQQQQQQVNGQRMVSLSDINPMMSAQPQVQLQQQKQLQAQQQQPMHHQQQQQLPQPVAPTPTTVQQVHYAPPTAAPQAPMPVAAPQPAPSVLVSAAPLGSVAGDALGAGVNGSRQISDRQQVLRHQQQRLLLLRHAAKCQHEDGRCPVTPHCAGMKRLWKHIAECKNQKCLVPHCVSSRYVLSHYHRCKDVRCPVCGPVREAIHRSHEKQKQMQALKQRHQQATQQQQGAPQPQTPTQPLTGGVATAPAVSVAPAPVTQPMVPPPVAQPMTAPVPMVPAPAPIVLAAPLPPQVQGPSSLAVEPAAKRQRIGGGIQPAPGFIMQPQQPQIQQPPPPMPQQPLQQQPPMPLQPITSQQMAVSVVSAVPAMSVVSTVASIPAQPLLAPSSVMHTTYDPEVVVSVPPAVTQVPQTASSMPQVQSQPPLALENGGHIMPAKPSGPKPQEDHTLINCFTSEQIENHIASLNKGLQLDPQQLKSKCLDVLKVLQSHQHGWVFNTPVDPVELGLPDYFEVIKKPMDLGTIRKKLENGVYQVLEDFEEHVLLTFENAMLYNPEGSVVYNMAKEMKEKFEQDYARLMEQLKIEEEKKRRNGEACLLCGCEKLLFEPPVFYCNGMNCPSKRIRRNSYYYVAGNNQYHWCHQCFQDLRDNTSIDLGDVTIKKEALVKKKNDEVHEESWVQCDRCERWIHQICALFNTRQNKDQKSEFACPRCTLEERRQKGITEGTSSTPMADDLPRTKLSEYLERHVRKKVDEFVEQKSVEKAATEGIPLEEARLKLQMGGNITIRQVTSMDRKLEVRERMKNRYAYKNYPDEFNFRCKSIVVFQNLDGVDVMLFGLYVYEHDEKNPLPNQRAVYISYLDSVHFMRPKAMRTFIYHEILISYLDYVRRRGFSTVHIWACPPLKGDDYILYAKPPEQKTPKDDRLRQWYLDLLIECQRRGIVGKLTNMYDLYFSNPKNDAAVVPYLDGDYFPAEVENIIKDIEEGKTGKKGLAQGKKKKEKKAQQKKKSGRGGTRSTGLDEEALKASGIVPSGSDAKSLEEGARDYVMMKLGETIQPMKESFIVGFLAWQGAKDEDMQVPKEIQEYREQHSITWKLTGAEAKPFFGEEELKDISIHSATNGSDQTASAPTNSAEVKEPDTATMSCDLLQPDVAVNSKETPNSSLDAVKKEDLTATPAPVVAASNAKPTTQSVNMAIREGKFAAMARKREREGSPKPDQAEEVKSEEKKQEEEYSKPIMVIDSKGRSVKLIDDDDEELDCEFLNNRQAFLNLCQGNHYQFDQLRRAKHSSMMVLWHLHNRDAPKFVQQCATCSREILTGYRYHCPTCNDFDQCQECVRNPKVPTHPHLLKEIAVANGQQNELTEAQRQERQRSIQLHMTLLQHAATCNSPKCPSANCTKMKGLLKHGAQCQVKATGGCNVCKRIWALLQLHARQCKLKTCSVPNCMAIRERVRQLKKQQQAMDDRRRVEMNRAYRGKR